MCSLPSLRLPVQWRLFRRCRPSSLSSAFLQEFPPLPSHKLCIHPVLTDFHDFKAASSGSSNTQKWECSQPASHLVSAPAAGAVASWKCWDWGQAGVPQMPHSHDHISFHLSLSVPPRHPLSPRVTGKCRIANVCREAPSFVTMWLLVDNLLFGFYLCHHSWRLQHPWDGPSSAWPLCSLPAHSQDLSSPRISPPRPCSPLIAERHQESHIP